MTTAPSTAIPITRTPRPDSLKINRLLRDAIRARPGASDTVLVTFRDPFASTRRSSPLHGQGRSTPPHVRHAEGDLGFPGRRARPASTSNKPTRCALVWRHGAAGARYRLAQALLVVIPLGAIDSLARRPDIIHIDQVLHGGGPPPMREGDCDSPHRLRCCESHRRRPVGGPGRQASPFSTPAFDSHVLLRPAPCRPQRCPIDVHSWLISTSWAGPRPWWLPSRRRRPARPGHGTSSAAILSANGAMGQSQLGLTRARIDSYRINDPPNGAGNAGVNWSGAPLALHDHAVLDGANYLIVAEIADEKRRTMAPLTGPCNYAAYNLGAMVIAA